MSCVPRIGFLASFTLTIMLSSVLPVYAQFQCGMTESPVAKQRSSRPGFLSVQPFTGAHLPTVGNIRALVLFIRTANDNLENEKWPLNELPVWAEQFTTDMHEYFSAMSNGSMDLKLDIYPKLLVTSRTEDEYLWASENFGTANREIIQRIDPEVDFTQYDRWTGINADNAVREGSDGRVDVVFAIYRRVTRYSFLPFSGVSDLGFPGVIFVDSTKRFFYGGSGEFNDAAASGLTLVMGPGKGEVTEEWYAFQIGIHEFMHKVYGEGHPTAIFGGLGVLSNSGGGLALSGYERGVLGYLNFMELNPGRDTSWTLHDCVTQREAAILPILQVAKWYYIFEFRGKFSKYDCAPVPGVYIYRLYDSWSSNNKDLAVIHADGNYQWAVDTVTQKPYKVRPDALSGFNVYQRLPINGTTYYADKWWGDPASAFSMARSAYTAYTNPSTDFMRNRDTIRTGIYIHVTAMNDSSATISLSYTPPPILDIRPVPATGISLAQNYPQPITQEFGYLTSIEYALDRSGPVVLEVFDSFGRLVETLVQDRQEAGVHRAVFSGNGRPAGMYVYRLRAGDAVLQRRLLIVR